MHIGYLLCVCLKKQNDELDHLHLTGPGLEAKHCTGLTRPEVYSYASGSVHCTMQSAISA